MCRTSPHILEIYVLSDLSDQTKEELLEEVYRLRRLVDSHEQAVSEHKHVDELLRGGEKERAWLEHSPVCTKIVDPDFNLQYMNTAGVKSLHISDISPYYG